MGRAFNLASLLNGSGLVSLTSKVTGSLPNDNIAAMAASKLTGQVPDANAPSGSVIQVVSVTKTDTASYATNNSLVDFVGFTATITPISTSSKILVMATVCSGQNGSNSPDMLLRLKRNGSAITGALADSAGNRARGSAGMGSSRQHYELNQAAYNYLDSPNSTSALTYGFDIKTGDTGFINRTGNDEDNGGGERGTCTLILMEIAG